MISDTPPTVRDFALDFDLIEHGWSPFRLVMLGTTFVCEASYLTRHPLCIMIHHALDLWDIFEQGRDLIMDEQDPETWDVHILEEPGGLLMKLCPCHGSIHVCVSKFKEDPVDVDWNSKHRTPDLEGMFFSWRDYALPVYQAAIRVLQRQGILGSAMGWDWRESHGMERHTVVPVTEFLALGQLLAKGSCEGPGSIETDLHFLQNQLLVNNMDTKSSL